VTGAEHKPVCVEEALLALGLELAILPRRCT
jgi:hypothetical protein